ncbi:MBL fold metallo-hydrolase [Sporolactobacillus pectinivorans]|uniref:MBL fold metallo-hydrolase n=1 Tax=Sporolactobacillus pectinivorans TaxID=1591408 RepID=UPI000C25EE2D|nr:MBL fold metallo-hydrolase [Sporolactobacillus pectinivorans]
MKLITCPVGPIHANCYILEDEKTNDALIIDPGDEFDKIESIIIEGKLHPLAVLLTHAHFDHIGALDEVRDQWKIPAYLHRNESYWLHDAQMNGSAYFQVTGPIHTRPAEKLLKGEQKMTIGPFSFTVLETAGHSPGGVSFYFEDDRTVFSGDTLFNGSIGRSDGFGADGEQLLQSIRDKLLTLPEDTHLCPGHGRASTIGNEAHTNPFLI